MTNPLYEHWCTTVGSTVRNWHRRYDAQNLLTMKDSDLSAKIERDVLSYKARWKLTEQFAFAIPTDDVIAAIVKHSPLVEMGAGTGYWASLLAKAGADVLAYDAIKASEKSGFGQVVGQYFPVGYGTPETLAKHEDWSLLLVWPSYDIEVGHECLTHWRGQTLIYVGEGCGGCCASDKFFETLAADFDELTCLDLPQWSGINDWCWIYQRKPEPGYRPIELE